MFLGGVENITREQAQSIIEENINHIDLILILGGFPCKDTSKLKWKRRNLAGAESGKFRFMVKFLEWARRFARNIPVRHLVENTDMDYEPMDQVSAALNTKPWFVNAGPILACTRPRLYWVDWEVLPDENEKVTHKEHFSVLELAEVEGKLDILENGWHRHDRLGKNFRCATGYRPANNPPVKPVGLSSASHKAKQRWRGDGCATQVYHYEDHALVWPSRAINESEVRNRCFSLGGRLLSCEELETALGFPRHYTLPHSERGNLLCFKK